jgi:hypothetical protein
LDEDAGQHSLLTALRLRGVDVTSAQEVGLIAATDEQQIEWCQGQGRVLFTYNVRDFYALHSSIIKSGEQHAGIVLAVQQRYSIGEHLRRLVRLIALKSAEEMTNCVEFLSSWK